MIRALASCAIALAVLLAPARAHARMMEHFDLAGLALHCDAIVVADRVGPRPVAPTALPLTRYRVIRSLHGTLKVGAEIDVYDQGYDTSGHAIDARVVMFLAKGDAGGWSIFPSGLRVVERGQVFRFEQQQNPGPFAMVPQGTDPQDEWQAGTPQLDRAGLERSIADALRRVAAFTAARAEKDPMVRRAAMLAVMPPPGDATSASSFYVDALARMGKGVLASAGDTEGALLIDARDHGAPGLRGPAGELPTLVDYASHTTNPIPLRVLAMHAIVAHRLDNLLPLLPRMPALLADPDPDLRADAATAELRAVDWASSDPATQQAIANATPSVRAELDARWAIETDRRVLYAIADGYEQTFGAAVPARANGPRLVTHVAVGRGVLEIYVVCVPSAPLARTALVATRDGAPVTLPAFAITPHCATPSSGTGSLAAPVAFAPGRYLLALTATLAGQPITVPLGAIVVGANGELTIEP